MNTVQYTVKVKDIDSFVIFYESFVTKNNLRLWEFNKI
jgi:hypothetical protein